ncbi:MAG TPA: shikimate kinase [Streptosporangiaceae bacterium]|nr:shikimate kinase [Streptosporangiaceae bacterium]
MTTTPEPPVILIGAPGAGKTTVGSTLAARLGVSFTDTDAIVEGVAGKPVSDIFISDGEPEFRRLERAAVATALAVRDQGSDTTRAGTPAAGVVGLGGGAVMDEQTQAELAGRAVVYLETGFAELAKRVGLDRARPLLIGTNPRAQLKSLLDQRLPVYSRLAWLTVNTDGREPAEIAAEIAGRVAFVIAGLAAPDARAQDARAQDARAQGNCR